MPSVRLVAAGLALALGASGCGAGTSGADTPTVYAAASLRTVLPTIDPGARFSFGGSGELAAQIREGAPADVFAAASPRHMRELVARGLVDRPVTFASNRIVMIVPTRNRAGIRHVGDVARPGTRLVIAAEGVPAGDYARAALAAMSLTTALDNVVSHERDVTGVVSKVVLGEADAGFVYATDVVPVGDAVRVLALPAAAQPEIEYQIAVVTTGPNSDAAREFIERVRGATGRAALTSAGFVVT